MVRHRYNRGGDRSLNRALHVITSEERTAGETLTALANGVITTIAPEVVDPAHLLSEALAEASLDLVGRLLQRS